MIIGYLFGNFQTYALITKTSITFLDLFKLKKPEKRNCTGNKLRGTQRYI